MKSKLLLLLCFLFISLKINAQSAVFEIARNGCTEDLMNLLKDSPDAINYKNESGFTALTIACYNGNLEVATLLAKHVVNINESGDMGTALMASVFKRDKEMTKMLLDSNADTNIADAKGTTALHYAVRFNNADLITQLIAHDADINIKDNNGLSPWDYAVQDKNESILKLLKN